ncbi:MAG: restriction endonuclease [Anaerolineae bacterium]
MTEEKKWETYEEVAAYLLEQMADKFGLDRFEGKQKVIGHRSGTEWEIDAKGVSDAGDIFLLVECRRYTTSRQSQEKVGALAYRIHDTGALGGIIVSPLGLQSGAEKVAKAENIHSVILDPNSTTTDYFLEYLNEIQIGLSERITISEKVTITMIKGGEVLEKQEIGDTIRSAD